MVTADPYRSLRQVTSARIALGRAGGSLPTQAWLDFQSAHAAARDAVHQPLDVQQLLARLDTAGTAAMCLTSRASDRATFLKRPDLGRRLSQPSRETLEKAASPDGCDLVVVISDGLSAQAAVEQAPPLLGHLIPKLQGWSLAPLVIIPFGRVAIQDEIGQALGARLALMLLGERPGLGSADSLGAYVTYGPRLGRTDAERNCVSNIRPQGQTSDRAAEAIAYLLTHARTLGLSGVGLKDNRLASPYPAGPLGLT